MMSICDGMYWRKVNLAITGNSLTSPLFGHSGLQGRGFGSALESRIKMEGKRTQRLYKEDGQH